MRHKMGQACHSRVIPIGIESQECDRFRRYPTRKSIFEPSLNQSDVLRARQRHCPFGIRTACTTVVVIANGGRVSLPFHRCLPIDRLFAIIWAESKSLHNRLISVFSGCVHFATQRRGVESA